MRLFSCASVVADDEREVSVIHIVQSRDEFVKRQTRTIAVVSSAAYSLVRRVHINDIVRLGIANCLPKIPLSDGGDTVQKAGRTEDVFGNCLRSGSLSSVVRALIELPIAVIAHRRLDTSCQEIEQIVRIAGIVEFLSDLVVIASLFSQLGIPKSLVGRDQVVWAVKDSFPQTHQGFICVTQKDMTDEAIRCSRDGNGAGTGERLKQPHLLLGEETQDCPCQSSFAPLIWDWMWKDSTCSHIVFPYPAPPCRRSKKVVFHGPFYPNPPRRGKRPDEPDGSRRSPDKRCFPGVSWIRFLICERNYGRKRNR